MENAYAVIMAGGAGTRLWPLSRKSRPKPLLQLLEDDRSLFQIAVDRLHPLFPPERVLVIANAHLCELLSTQTPHIPEENFIVEPAGRDTGPAVGLAAVHVHHRAPNGVMAILTADHIIRNEQKFRDVLAAACEVAASGDIVTLGIKPDYPATGFGYIDRGEHFKTVDGIDVYALKRFIEKPDEDTAQSFLDAGTYSWNSGMFVWPTERVLVEFERHAPQLHTHLAAIADELEMDTYDDVLRETWSKVEKKSVDYALMEHIDEGIRVIPVEMGWADIGNFKALHTIRSDEETDNVTRGPRSILLDTRGSVVFSEKLVATIGL
ncbi:MAG: mannose-1-phosphate guanylyltransferase, partial [Anaerolineae bacterium]